jgi:rubredoxin
MVIYGLCAWKKNKKGDTAMKYECVCGYVYDEAAGDPENGIAAGTKWADVPEDYECPVCGAGKTAFSEI